MPAASPACMLALNALGSHCAVDGNPDSLKSDKNVNCVGNYVLELLGEGHRDRHQERPVLARRTRCMRGRGVLQERLLALSHTASTPAATPPAATTQTAGRNASPTSASMQRSSRRRPALPAHLSTFGSAPLVPLTTTSTTSAITSTTCASTSRKHVAHSVCGFLAVLCTIVLMRSMTGCKLQCKSRLSCR